MMQNANIGTPKIKKASKYKLSDFRAYLWLLPCLLLVSIFVFLPVIQTITTSFSEVSQAGLTRGFAGTENFEYLFRQKVFGKVMINTFIWVVSIVSISMILSLSLAMVLNNVFVGRKFLRTILLLPWATAQLVTASAWKYIFDYHYGSMNTILMKLGIIKSNINFMGNPDLAFICLIIVGIVVTIPFMTFTLLAGLQAISDDYYEAAVMDGATFKDKLFHITLPLLKPSINISIVLNLIYVFNSFTIVHTITGGAPANQTATIMTYLYYLAFRKQRYGPAAAISVIGFIILFIFAIVYMKFQMKEDD